ncbi:MAG: 16S rRNA (guanine(966)-N(2))-methyltransferase RsmD [Ruminococcaceae bacterium]|nr:16S rRNA (guanine(966)-N(2))-methyltransferase RsmD [Oscillospiraceae bacterium]
MRVITGSARGTKLDTLESDNTRPTSDRVKEALFSMIQFDIEGRVVLDLFAGSGQLAIEALSRGAAKATLIDQSREAVDIIIENAKKTHLFEKCRISAADYKSFIRGASGREKYDIVFLDPPYDSGLLPESLKALSDGDLFANGAYIVCETDCDIPVKAKRLRKDEEITNQQVLNDVFGGDEELRARFDVLKSVLYGRTRITLLTPVK